MWRGSNGLVILSEAKDHLAEVERRKMILRFAQDDTFVYRSGSSPCASGVGLLHSRTYSSGVMETISASAS
jgi:hypothetical protein